MSTAQTTAARGIGQIQSIARLQDLAKSNLTVAACLTAALESLSQEEKPRRRRVSRGRRWRLKMAGMGRKLATLPDHRPDKPLATFLTDRPATHGLVTVPVHSDIILALRKRCGLAGVDFDRLVPALLHNWLLQMTPKRTGQTLIDTLTQWEASKRRHFRAWDEAEIRERQRQQQKGGEAHAA